MLPLDWTPANQTKALLLINRIAKAILQGEQDTLKGALQTALASSTTMRKATDWSAAAKGLQKSLMESRNEIKPKTWATNYQPYINEALRVLTTNKSITDGHGLLQATLAKWKGKPASKEACCIALRNLTDYAVARCHAAACWKIDTSSIRELKGKKTTKRTKATLDDKDLLNLIDIIEDRNPRWANVLRLLALYGLRPVELQYLTAKRRTDGSIGLWCSYSKNCGGALTAPRWLEPCPLTNERGEKEHWNLAGAMAASLLELPLTKDGNPRALDGHYVEQFLARQDEWKRLKKQCEERGEWLRCYTFRDSYSLRCHRYEIEIGAIAHAMGHSVAIHASNYRWASTENTKAQFAQVR